MSRTSRLCRRILSSAIFFLSSFISVAQDTTALVLRAQQMAKATVEKDYSKIVDLSHPALVKVMGGFDSMLIVVAEGWESLSNRGMDIDTVYFGAPRDFQRENDSYYAFIPQVLVMSIPRPGEKMIAISYLMAISGIDGKRWAFVDATGLEGEKLQYLFPDYSGRIPKPFVDKPIVVNEVEVEGQLQKIWAVLGDR